MKEAKQLVVSAIQNGTVIDHVPAKNLFMSSGRKYAAYFLVEQLPFTMLNMT